MLLKCGYIILISIFLLSFQLTIGDFLEWGGIKPDWLLLMVVITSYLLPVNQGLFTQWLLGVLQDICSGTTFGSWAFLYLCTGFVIYFLRGLFFGEDVITKTIFTFIGCFFCQVTYGVGLAVFSTALTFKEVLFKSLSITSYTTLIGFVIFIILGIISHWLRIRRLRRELNGQW